ncbi:WD repeat-containing protein 87, partial [Biomphalaria pfeifferi]
EDLARPHYTRASNRYKQRMDFQEFLKELDCNDVRLQLLTPWERLLLTKRPIIAPDGYIPNSVVRRRLHFVQPESPKPVWQLKPVPEFDPRYLPDGWKIKKDKKNGSEHLKVTTTSIQTEVKEKSRDNELLRHTDTMVVTKKDGFTKVRHEYQNGSKELHRVEFNLGVQTETEKTKEKADDKKLLDNVASKNPLNLEKKEEKLAVPDSDLTRLLQEVTPDSSRNSPSFKGNKHAKHKTKHKARETQEHVSKQPITELHSNELTANKGNNIIQQLLQETWFPLKGQLDIMDILEEILKLLETNLDDVFAPVCQYLIKIYQLLGIAEEILNRAKEKLTIQLKNQSAVIADNSRRTLDQLDLMSELKSKEKASDETKKANVGYEVVTDPERQIELNPTEDTNTQRLYISRSSSRSRSKASNKAKDKRKRSKGKQSSSSKTLGLPQTDSGLIEDEVIKNMVLGNEESTNKNMLSNQNVIDSSRASTGQMGKAQDNTNKQLELDIGKEKGKVEEYIVVLPKVAHSEDVSMVNDTLEMGDMKKDSSSESNSQQTAAVRREGLVDSGSGLILTGGIGSSDGSSGSGMNDKENQMYDDSNSCLNDSDSDGESIRSSEEHLQLPSKNFDGNTLVNDLSSQGAIVGSHTAIDLYTHSLSSIVSKSSQKTSSDAQEGIQYDDQDVEKVKTVDSEPESKKLTSLPAVNSSYPVQYTVIGAPAPQYRHTKEKANNNINNTNSQDGNGKGPSNELVTLKHNLWSNPHYNKLETYMPYSNKHNRNESDRQFPGILLPNIELPVLPGQDTTLKKELLLAFCEGLPTLNRRTPNISPLQLRNDDLDKSFTNQTASCLFSRDHRSKGHSHCEHMKCAHKKMHRYISISKFLSNVSLSQRMGDLSARLKEKTTFGISRYSYVQDY